MGYVENPSRRLSATSLQPVPGSAAFSEGKSETITTNYGTWREASPVDPAHPPKILLYSHDTFGLGNIRRTLLLADEFKTSYPGASILIITGSPMIHAFRIPDGVDYIK